MDSEGYKQAWVRPSTLEGLNKRIHDGVPLDQLAARAADRRDTFFELLFPYARPTDGARVLELGQGVGWIMESMLERYPIAEIVGLDVSPVMIESAQRALERSTRPTYVLYDGLHVPLEDDSFDNVYSVACLQHIEKHHAFLAMKELVRLLKPGGHGTLHLISIHHLPQSGRTLRGGVLEPREQRGHALDALLQLRRDLRAVLGRARRHRSRHQVLPHELLGALLEGHGPPLRLRRRRAGVLPQPRAARDDPAARRRARRRD